MVFSFRVDVIGIALPTRQRRNGPNELRARLEDVQPWPLWSLLRGFGEHAAHDLPPGLATAGLLVRRRERGPRALHRVGDRLLPRLGDEDRRVRGPGLHTPPDAEVRLPLHDALRDIDVRHLDSLVRILPIPAVPLADANERPAWNRPHPLGHRAVALRPPAHRERARAAPVERAVDAPRARNGEGLEHMPLARPDVVEHSAGDDVPVPVQPGLAPVHVAIGAELRGVVRLGREELLVLPPVRMDRDPDRPVAIPERSVAWSRIDPAHLDPVVPRTVRVRAPAVATRHPRMRRPGARPPRVDVVRVPMSAHILTPHP